MTTNAPPHIVVDHLVKEFRVAERDSSTKATFWSLFRRKHRQHRAVDDVTFTIGAGERVGFLGPNGAGKTTTLKMLAGLLHPTSGSVRIDGETPQQRQESFLKKITLVMGQKQQLLWDLPPRDTFAMNGAIYDIGKAQLAETIAELSALLEVESVINRPTRQLSLGERMKCELVAALLHRPKVLFLDEPTIGLDVSMQLVMRKFLRDYNERFGATLLLTSHYMDDVAALCPRILVIDKGRLSYDGTLHELVQRVRPGKRVRWRASDGQETVLTVAAADVSRTVTELLQKGEGLDLTIEDPPLEEVMRDLFAETEGARDKTAKATDGATKPASASG